MSKKQKQSRKPLLLAGLVIIFIGLGIFAWQLHRSNTSKAATPTVSVNPTNTVDHSPATAADNAANEARKSDTTATSKDGSTLNNTPAANGVSIVITHANATNGDINVAASVAGTTSGTCTFSFASTSGGSPVKQVTEPVSGTGSSQSYQCANMAVPGLASGTWYVSATITSDTGTASNNWAGTPPTL